MADAKNATTTLLPCPCSDCELRKDFARVFDLHWHDGEDCPYECPPYRDWKEVDA